MSANTGKILHRPGRRLFLGAAATTFAATALPAFAQTFPAEEEAPASPARNNASAFRTLRWQDHFDNLHNGVIIADLDSRAVHYWSEDGQTYLLFPSSVPLSEELTRRGRTEVIQKVENPTWTPTPSMLAAHPDWPKQVAGGAPENPLGVRALYLSWPAYRIHGTHDTRKIGRRSSSGCVGLYNEHILMLYPLTKVGTQVVLI